MAHDHLHRLSALLSAAALTLSVLFVSACGGSQPGVTHSSEAQAAQTTVSTSVPSTAPTTATPTTAAPTTAAPTTAAPARDENWDLQLTVDLTEPDAFSFVGTGHLLFRIDGDQARVTGVVEIGESAFGELVCDGVLEGDQFTVLTTEFSVKDLNGEDIDTLDVTLESPPFALKGDTVQTTGSIVLVNNAIGITESGTFTIILTKNTK